MQYNYYFLSLFNLEFYCFHLVKPHVAICHQIHLHLISLEVLRHVDLQLQLYLSLH